VAADSDYVFQPTATDPEGDPLRFSALKLPAWAGLDPLTGRIAGRPRPSDQGVYGPIVVTVSDGRNAVDLPEFTITVGPAGRGQDQPKRGVTLSWRPPERNADGSPIGRPPRYRIHYGRASRVYDRSVQLDDPGVSRYTFTDLEPGTWYLAMTAVGDDDIESDYSQETVAVVD
jgi:hypothetical protein